MVELILIPLAAMISAVAHTVDFHFDVSVFKKWNPKFWCRNVSSEYAKKVFGYKIDAWHICNSLVIVLWVLTAIFHQQVFAWYWELLIWGLLWNVPFNLLYNALYKKI